MLLKNNYKFTVFLYKKTTQKYFYKIFLKIRRLEPSLKIIKKTQMELVKYASRHFCTKKNLKTKKILHIRILLHKDTFTRKIN